nr:MAG TPA: hypothetical protein [Caudoviricetes sp.]
MTESLCNIEIRREQKVPGFCFLLFVKNLTKSRFVLAVSHN